MSQLKYIFDNYIYNNQGIIKVCYMLTIVWIVENRVHNFVILLS